MIKDKVIKFDKGKDFKYVRPLGLPGGTGETYLFKDETMNMFFAIKKYVPQDTEHIDDYYRRFIEEIKILLQISHPNIVRVYNYYLYPEFKTGYLQMEYVNGTSIDKFIPNEWGKSWEDIFIETITAFEYLEKNNILHRDVRPANILIDENGSVKIIDFGFGKKIDSMNQEGNSILLNWPATEMPDEVQQNGEYKSYY